jgi:hypothetical protein
MILIIGTPEDGPSAFIHEKLHRRGIQAQYLDTTRFPHEIRLTFDPADSASGFIQTDPSLPAVPLADITGVYRRWSRGVKAPEEPDPVLREAVYWNIEATVGSFMRCLNHCRWVNPWVETELHNYKGRHLQLMATAGIRIPKTLITNDPEQLKAFYEDLDRKAIYKPVRGWAHTTQLTEADFTPDRLEGLNHSPVKVQEMIDGVDIRAYVVGNEVFAMEIRSDTLDFRENPNAPRVPIVLPDKAQVDCFRIAEVTGLVFTGIDLRRTPEGEYVFFEANPTPVFVYDEQVSGYPISERIVDLLIGSK